MSDMRNIILYCLLFSTFWPPVINIEKEILFLISGNSNFGGHETEALKKTIIETIKSVSAELDSADTKMGVMWCKANADFQVASRMSERQEMQEKLGIYLDRNLKSKQSTLSGLAGSMDYAKKSVFSRSYYTTKIAFLLASTEIKMSDAWDALKETCSGIISFVLLFPRLHQKCGDKPVLKIIEDINEVQNSSKLLRQKRVMCVDEKTDKDFGVKLAKAEETNGDIIKHCIVLDFKKRKRFGGQKSLVNKKKTDVIKDDLDETSDIIIGISVLIVVLLVTFVMAVIVIIVYKRTKRRQNENFPHITQTLADERSPSIQSMYSGSNDIECQENSKKYVKGSRKNNENLLSPAEPKSASTSKLTSNEASARLMVPDDDNRRRSASESRLSRRTPIQRRKSCSPRPLNEVKHKSSNLSIPNSSRHTSSDSRLSRPSKGSQKSVARSCASSTGSKKKPLKYNKSN